MQPDRIDHIGIAVKSLDQALTTWRDLLGFTVIEERKVPSEGIRVAFLDVGNTRIELMEPMEDDCAVARFLKKRGEGIQHVALAVDNVEDAANYLEAKDMWIERIPDACKPLAFIHPISCNGIALELVENK